LDLLFVAAILVTPGTVSLVKLIAQDKIIRTEQIVGNLVATVILVTIGIITIANLTVVLLLILQVLVLQHLATATPDLFGTPLSSSVNLTAVHFQMQLEIMVRLLARVLQAISGMAHFANSIVQQFSTQ